MKVLRGKAKRIVKDVLERASAEAERILKQRTSKLPDGEEEPFLAAMDITVSPEARGEKEGCKRRSCYRRARNSIGKLLHRVCICGRENR